ncbi:hypothetical protein PP753_gp51 [Dinoroseobacter phage vB_DshP-R7L]|uniref:Virion protein n=1 Tax=Dinoroseobacter phage vB_DshP-R7L TaxID=2873349 RepID=A0AAE8XBI7_9CAUD|nr:hypothetical protein PP753_gp51 [Dinoroseobacter phage vB_DshP-R7L]UAT28907.1 hypothetical protein R7L_gp68 [Dinoroseobacter phage vB_DshP-R7L]
MNPQLQFPSSVGSATTNGNQLGSWATGVTQQVTAPATPSVGSTAMPNVQVDTPVTPNATGTGAQTGGGNFWSKDGGAGMILGGVQVLGNLWSSFQAHKMAKEQMSFAREQWDTNLANQTKTYNTALEDRIRGRYAAGDRTDEQVQGEIDRHSL